MLRSRLPLASGPHSAAGSVPSRSPEDAKVRGQGGGGGQVALQNFWGRRPAPGILEERRRVAQISTAIASSVVSTTAVRRKREVWVSSSPSAPLIVESLSLSLALSLARALSIYIPLSRALSFSRCLSLPLSRVRSLFLSLTSLFLSRDVPRPAYIASTLCCSLLTLGLLRACGYS